MKSVRYSVLICALIFLSKTVNGLAIDETSPKIDEAIVNHPTIKRLVSRVTFLEEREKINTELIDDLKIQLTKCNIDQNTPGKPKIDKTIYQEHLNSFKADNKTGLEIYDMKQIQGQGIQARNSKTKSINQRHRLIQQITEKMSPVPQPEEDRDRPNQSNAELENLEHPDIVINADSSDEEIDADDADDDGYMGYQALPLDNENDSSEDEGIGQEGPTDPNLDGPTGNQQPSNVSVGADQAIRLHQFADGLVVPSYMQVPEVPRPDKDDLLWNQPRTSDISMETGHEDKIKTVMAGIKLPSCNIPDWAKTLSEDQWQTQIVSKLKGPSQAPADKEQKDNESEKTDLRNTCDMTDSKPNIDNTKS